MSQSQPPPSRLSSPNLVVLVQDALACLGSLPVLCLYSWLGVGESLVLLPVGLNFFLHRAIFSRMGLMIDINALVKSNDQKSAINKAIPRPTIITINVRGIHQHLNRSQLLGLLPLNLLLLQEQDLGNLHRRFVLFLLLILLGDVWAFVLSFFHTLIFIMRRLTMYFHSG